MIYPVLKLLGSVVARSEYRIVIDTVSFVPLAYKSVPDIRILLVDPDLFLIEIFSAYDVFFVADLFGQTLGVHQAHLSAFNGSFAYLVEGRAATKSAVDNYR